MAEISPPMDPTKGQGLGSTRWKGWVFFFIVMVIVLIFFGALCSASEAAVLAASRVRLYHLAKKGDRRASTVLDLQAHIGGFISAIILLNTWFNTFVTAFAVGILTFSFGA